MPMHVRVFADSQCQELVWLTATRTSTSPTLIWKAASQLTRPGTRIGDSGTSS